MSCLVAIHAIRAAEEGKYYYYCYKMQITRETARSNQTHSHRVESAGMNNNK